MQIGPIELQDFEVPPSVHFGGGYRMRVHRLSSGQRAIERLGPDDDDIQFRGIFSGPEAEARVRALNSIRLSGQTVWLVWQSFRYPVLIKKFVASYENPWWIPYSIRCAVARQQGLNDTLAAAISILVASDLTAATALSPQSTAWLAPLQTTMLAPDSSIPASSGQAQAALAAQTAVVSISNAIDARSQGLLGAASVPPTCQTVADMVDSAGFLAGAVASRSYVARAASNLSPGA
jgi:hypothetical protein